MENRDLSIVIPFQYGGSKWENNELRYTLRSLSSNLNFNYDITIYSDKPIDWLKNVRVEVVDRYYPKQALKKFNNIPHYENFYDTLNKLRVISNDVELCEDILYVYDDILLMKPQNLEQVKVLYAGSRFEANKEYWLIEETINGKTQYSILYVKHVDLEKYLFMKRTCHDIIKRVRLRKCLKCFL